MNKRILLSFVLSVGISATAFCQQKMTSAQYLEQYNDFVVSVEKQKTITKSQYESLDSVYEHFSSMYKTYKENMTVKQVEKYNELKSRYRRRIIKYRTRRIGNDAEDVSDTVSNKVGNGVGSVEKSIRKTGATVGGFLKGMFGKDDSTTTK